MKRNRGFALAVALMAIVLIAVIVTGALFAASQATRSSEEELLDNKASAYAELAALRAIAGWSGPTCDALAVGAVLLESPPAEPPLESAVYVTRLDSALFLVVGEGRVAARGVTLLRRRVAVAVRTARDASGKSSALPLSEHAWVTLYQM
jgi:hypothetical protein